MTNGFATDTILPFGHGGTEKILSMYLSSAPGIRTLEKHRDRPMSLLTKLQEVSELLGRGRWHLVCTWQWLQEAESPETM